MPTKIKLMVNDLPNRMPCEIITEALKPENIDNFLLLGCSFAERKLGKRRYHGGCFSAISASRKENIVGRIREDAGEFISVHCLDSRHAIQYIDFYCRHNLPFAMGVSNGEVCLEEVRGMVWNSDICAFVENFDSVPIPFNPQMMLDGAKLVYERMSAGEKGGVYRLSDIPKYNTVPVINLNQVQPVPQVVPAVIVDAVLANPAQALQP